MFLPKRKIQKVHGTTSLRVVIPSEVVDFFKLKEGMFLQFNIEEDKIIVKVVKE